MEDFLALISELTGDDGRIDAAVLTQRISEPIARLQEQAAQADALRLQEKKRFALMELLVRSGANDVDYLLFRLTDLARFDADGNLLDPDALIADAKERFPDFFSSARRRLSGVRPGEGDSGSALGLEEFGRMSFKERLKLFEDDPDLYRSLKAAE